MDNVTLGAAIAIAKNNSGGGGGGVLVVHSDPDTGVLDKTWKEIVDAGFSVMPEPGNDEGDGPCWLYGGGAKDFPSEGDFAVFYYDFSNDGITVISFAADSENGYPVPYQP